MIAVSPYILLIVFGLFLAAYVFFAIVNIVLLARYGARNYVGFLACFIFIGGTAVILFMTSQSIIGVDWNTAVPLVTIPTLSF